jgi:hypothetical protein
MSADHDRRARPIDTSRTVVFSASRWQAAGLVLGSAAFVTGGYWMTGDPDPTDRAWGYACMVFFGLCGLAGAYSLLSGSYRLEVSPSAIALGKFVLPWSDVADVGTVSISGQAMVTITLKPEARERHVKSRMLRAANAGLGVGDLILPTGALAIRHDELLLLVRAYSARYSR